MSYTCVDASQPDTDYPRGGGANEQNPNMHPSIKKGYGGLTHHMSRNSYDIYSQSENPRDPYPVQSGWQHLKWNVSSFSNNSSISSFDKSTSFMFATRCSAVHQPQDTVPKCLLPEGDTDPDTYNGCVLGSRSWKEHLSGRYSPRD